MPRHAFVQPRLPARLHWSRASAPSDPQGDPPMPRQFSRARRFGQLTLWMAGASLVLSAVPIPVLAAPPTISHNIAIDDTRLLPNTSRHCGMDVYLHQYGTIG